MTLRQLSKTQFLPEEVQEVIWGFGWHLNLGVITDFQCRMQEGGNRTAHCIYRAFVKTPPGGVDVDAYKAILGIPLGFNAMGKPLPWVYPPPAEQYWGGFSALRLVCEYGTLDGVETWTARRYMHHYDYDVSGDGSNNSDDSDDGGG